MNVVVVTPIWQNYRWTSSVLESWARWHWPGWHFRFVIVGSEGRRSRNVVPDDARFHYIEHPNRPLGGKFNAGIRYTCEMKWLPHYLMIMGSDQVVKPEIFGAYERVIAQQKPVYIGLRDLYVADLESNRVVYWPGYTGDFAGVPIGPGRLVRIDECRRLDFKLYPEQDRSLDVPMHARLPEPELLSSKAYLNTKIQTPASLTPFSAYGRLPSLGPVNRWLQAFGIIMGDDGLPLQRVRIRE